MNHFEQLRNFTESDQPTSEQFYKAIHEHNLNVNDVIPVTVYDQECLYNSNKNIKNRLRITCSILVVNVLFLLWYLMNIEKKNYLPVLIETVQPVLNNFTFLEETLKSTHTTAQVAAIVAWSIVCLVCCIFMIKRTSDLVSQLDYKLKQYPSFIQFDKQPIICVKVVELNAKISEFLKPAIVVSILLSLQTSMLIYSNSAHRNNVDDSQLQGEIGTLVNHDTNYRVAMDQAITLISQKYDGPIQDFMYLQLLLKYKPLIDPVEYQGSFSKKFEKINSSLEGDESKETSKFILNHPNYTHLKSEFDSL